MAYTIVQPFLFHKCPPNGLLPDRESTGAFKFALNLKSTLNALVVAKTGRTTYEVCDLIRDPTINLPTNQQQGDRVTGRQDDRTTGRQGDKKTRRQGGRRRKMKKDEER